MCQLISGSETFCTPPPPPPQDRVIFFASRPPFNGWKPFPPPPPFCAPPPPHTHTHTLPVISDKSLLSVLDTQRISRAFSEKSKGQRVRPAFTLSLTRPRLGSCPNSRLVLHDSSAHSALHSPPVLHGLLVKASAHLLLLLASTCR